jgi:serine protease Do
VIQNGVLVRNVVKGPGRDAGIQRGDVILRIQNNIIRDVADFDKIVKNLPAGKSIAVLIQRQGSPVFLALKIEK